MAYVILHGWQGSGPDHWQTWLAGRLREAGEDVRYPDLPDPDAPRLEPWLDAIAREPADVVVCHSLACIAWLHLVSRGGANASRTLLVAPPSLVAELAEFFPVPLPRLERTELWCADDDPYCPEGAGELYGDTLGLPTRVFAGGGHLNPDAGYGPWPEVESWCRSSGAKNGVDT